MTNTEKLNAIRARCVELLEIAAKRTPGKWHTDNARGVILESGIPLAYPFGTPESERADADFIASCAGASEAGWRATIAAIDLYNQVQNHYGRNNKLLHAFLDASVDEILTAWEGLV